MCTKDTQNCESLFSTRGVNSRKQKNLLGEVKNSRQKREKQRFFRNQNDIQYQPDWLHQTKKTTTTTFQKLLLWSLLAFIFQNLSNLLHYTRNNFHAQSHEKCYTLSCFFDALALSSKSIWQQWPISPSSPTWKENRFSQKLRWWTFYYDFMKMSSEIGKCRSPVQQTFRADKSFKWKWTKKTIGAVLACKIGFSIVISLSSTTTTKKIWKVFKIMKNFIF